LPVYNFYDLRKKYFYSNGLMNSIPPGFQLEQAVILALLVARTSYEIIFSPEAVEDLRTLEPNIRSTVCDAIKEYLRHEPTKTRKNRIKRLRGTSPSQFRLRVDDLLIVYDVTETTIKILAIVLKSEVEAWLEKVREPDEENSAF
jgi:mRNA-degrading endonuclease RelE of RelBE toxin-antitoxin system